MAQSTHILAQHPDLVRRPSDPRREVRELETLRDVLRYAVTCFNDAGVHCGHGSESALDEAAYLILETLGLPVDDFNAFADARLTNRERELLGTLLAFRIEQRLPSAYLTGRTYLRGRSFRSDARALVPRSFIAELLTERETEDDAQPQNLFADPEAIVRVLDLCTGGGSLAIIAAQVFPNAMIDAVDLSIDALQLAAENVADYDLGDRITLLQGDLFEPVAGEQYDLIITNPPYVDAETMAVLPQEYRHEPQLALAGGDDGFDLVRRILRDARRHLKPDGGLLCEIGTDYELLEAHFPTLPFLWLSTENSENEVFWLHRSGLG